MRRNKYLTAAFTVLMALSIVNLPAKAEDPQKELQEVNEQIREQREALDENRREQSSVAADVKELDQEINSTQAALTELTANISDVEDNIADLQTQVDELETRLINQQAALGDRLVFMYEGGDVTYLEVLLGSSDFQDFLTRVEMLNQIVNQDREMIQGVQDDKNTLDVKVAELDNQRKELEESRRDQRTKEATLKESKETKEEYVKKLESDAHTFEQELNDLEATSNLLAQQIRDQQQGTDYSASLPDGSSYTVGTGQYIYPCPGYTEITSGYGMRLHPILGYYKMHTGVDFGVPEGVPILAADSGTVISAGWMGGYGNCVIVDHGAGMSTLYAHQSEILVSEGQAVKQGETIGLVGSTGYSTGAHLHFEVRVNGDPVDPTGYL